MSDYPGTIICTTLALNKNVGGVFQIQECDRSQYNAKILINSDFTFRCRFRLLKLFVLTQTTRIFSCAMFIM